MKPILLPTLVSILIPFAFAQVSSAQMPVRTPPAQVAPAPVAPAQGAIPQELATKGTVVLLDNDELIEGEITRTGDVCRIRRGSGETALPVSRVRAILGSRAEALATMRKGINPDNSLDHYKLAVWCYRQGMIAEATASADKAAEISPKNQTFVRYAQAMRELAARPPAAVAAPAPEVNKEALAVLPDDFVPDAWPSYLQKIQPILLNTCLDCHNKEKGGAFQIERTSADNRRGSMNNLVAALKQIDRKNPEKSALVTKSITPHGGATLPPIRTWQPAVAKTLEEWTANAVQPAPRTDPPKSLPAVAVRPVPIVPAPLSSPMPVGGLPASKDVPDLFPDAPKEKPTATVPFASDSKSQVEPAKKPEPIDPFDPDIFNGKVAPKK